MDLGREEGVETGGWSQYQLSLVDRRSSSTGCCSAHPGIDLLYVRSKQSAEQWSMPSADVAGAPMYTYLSIIGVRVAGTRYYVKQLRMLAETAAGREQNAAVLQTGAP